jgi:integrase/recombinase XerD
MSVVGHLEKMTMTTDILLSKAIEGFLLARSADGYSPGTLEQYKWALKMLLEMGDKPLQQIDITHLRNFMAFVQQKPNLSATSVFHVWKTIRAFYKWTSAEGLSDRPDKLLSRPRAAYREIKPLTKDELKALLKAAERTKPSDGRRKPFTMRRPTALRDVAIILLLLDTGLRAGELCRLTSEDIDLKNAQITVRPYLSGIKSRPRVIPIGQMTSKALWRYQFHAKYRGKTFFGLNPNSLLQLLRNLGDRAGVSNVHPHRFRHTFAIEYLRNGGDVFTLQRILGHTTLKMVQHYLAIADTDTHAAHRRASPVENWHL